MQIDVAVAARTADQRIVSRPSVKNVIAPLADQNVVGIVAQQPVRQAIALASDRGPGALEVFLGLGRRQVDRRRGRRAIVADKPSAAGVGRWRLAATARPRVSGRLEDDIVLQQIDALAEHDAVRRLVPLNALDREQMIDPALKHRHVIRDLVRDPVAIEGDADGAGAGIIHDVGSVGRVCQIRLAAMQDVEPRGPLKEVVAFAAVELIDPVPVGASDEGIAAVAAEQRREVAFYLQDIVAARADERRGPRRHVQAIGQALRGIAPRVIDQRRDGR